MTLKAAIASAQACVAVALTCSLVTALLAILLFGLSVSSAQNAVVVGDTLLTTTFVIQQGAVPIEVFRMEPGACLRGPLKFFDLNGTVKFQLERGVEYPTGCAANKPD